MYLRKEMTGVLMCGGKGRRMGYVPKQNLMIDGETFQTRILRSMNGFGEIALSCNVDVPGYTVWQDYFIDRGPIGGVHSSLLNATYQTIFVVACDSPNLSSECIDYLIAQLSDEDDCLVPVVDDYQQSLCAIYKRRIITIVEDQIFQCDYKMRSLLQKIKTHYVCMPDKYKNDFYNVNTPQTLESLKTMK